MTTNINIPPEAVEAAGDAVAAVPQLQRGMVWCRKCGRSERVNAAGCLANGWPKCCGYTMTIDSPKERAAPTALKEDGDA